jgi:hypothetical protein
VTVVPAATTSAAGATAKFLMVTAFPATGACGAVLGGADIVMPDIVATGAGDPVAPGMPASDWPAPGASAVGSAAGRVGLEQAESVAAPARSSPASASARVPLNGRRLNGSALNGGVWGSVMRRMVSFLVGRPDPDGVGPAAARAAPLMANTRPVTARRGRTAV